MQPFLSACEACELHCELLLHTAVQLQRSSDSVRELWIAEHVMHPWLLRVASHFDMDLRVQNGEDLGERMLHALEDGLARFSKVLLVGSDCPGLDSDYLRTAATLLDACDMVWGPAADGGYVLVGASRIDAACFRGIDWGSAAVMSQTLQRATESDISHALLPMREDIDRPQDLQLWRAIQDRESALSEQVAGVDALAAQARLLCIC